MKLTLFQAVVFLSALSNTFAQGTLEGQITEANGSPLQEVKVYIGSLKKGTTSDQLGRFSIKGIVPGEYEVTFSSIGFRTQQQMVIVRQSETTTVTIMLEQGELVLADVVITDHLTGEINTISQVDIKLRPVNTSQDILRMVPGIFIAQHAGGGKAEQIFLRGFDIDHGTDINLEVDGLPVNMVSHAHGQGYSDLHFLIPEIVGTVDFNKGPYYADKGNLATAGYAAFHTKNALDQNMVKVEGGRFGTFRNVNAFNIVHDEQGDWHSNAYVAAEYFRTDGYFDHYQHFNRINLIGKYNTYRGDHEAFTAAFSTFNSRWDASGQIPMRAVKDGTITRFGSIDPTEGGETSRTNLWIRYLNRRGNGGLFEHQVYFTIYDFSLVSNFTFFLNDPINGDQITQRESRNIYGYKGTYSIDHSLNARPLKSEFGGGIRYDDVNDIHLYHTRSGKVFVSDVARGDIDETNLYAYASETLELTSALTINTALRLDHFTFNYIDALTAGSERQSVSKAVVSPKLNFSYHPNQKLDVFLKSGIGFHSNDTRVVVAQKGNEILPRAYGVDVGGNFKINENLILHTALWMLDLDQEFVYVGDEGVVEPSGKTRRQGIDFSLRYQALTWLYIDSDVNLTKPRSKEAAEGKNYIPLAPTLTSIGGLSCKLPNGFNASLRYRYIKDRPANEDNSVVAAGYFLLDAVVKYTQKSFELSVTAENLLNNEWNEAQFDTGSRLQHEVDPVSEIHFTPGTPLFIKAGVSIFF
jgi:hypothetical protein